MAKSTRSSDSVDKLKEITEYLKDAAIDKKEGFFGYIPPPKDWQDYERFSRAHLNIIKAIAVIDGIGKDFAEVIQPINFIIGEHKGGTGKKKK